MRKTVIFKLRYNRKRAKTLHRQIDLAGSIYNHMIALHKRYYRMFGKSLNANKLKVHVTKLKKLKKFSYWHTLGSQAIQDIAERIDRAYKHFFNHVKEQRKGRKSPPGFKKRSKYKSFTLKQAGWAMVGKGKIRIGQNLYRFHQSREIEGRIKTVTIKRDKVGDVFLCFSLETETAEINATAGEKVGYDFGLKTFLTSSVDAEPDIQAPQPFKRALTALRKANQALSRKQRGSRHRREARMALAKAHRRVANLRKDWHFKTAARLVKGRSHIFLEDLNITGMKALWGRKVSDLGFAEFVNILKYQAQKTGTVVHQINRWLPSTKLCDDCGTVNDALTLADRVWTCECGTVHDRDRSAAKKILRFGCEALGLVDVRPSLTGLSMPEAGIPVL